MNPNKKPSNKKLKKLDFALLVVKLILLILESIKDLMTN